MGEKSLEKSESAFLAFAKSTGIFFVGNTLSKVITLLLIPLYTNTLPTTAYGYYDLSVTVCTLVTSFLYCDVWSSVMRLMRDDLDGEAPWKVVTAGWVIFGCSTVLFVLVCLLASLFFEIPALGLIILYGLTTNIESMFSCIARGKGDNVDFAVSGVLCTVINVGLNLALILGIGMGYEALYISYAAGFASQCLYLAVRMRLWRHLALPTAGQIKELLVYSAPLGVNSVAYWLLSSLSRVVVSTVLSLAANGIFAIGSKFGSTVALATTCFTLAWQDIAFTKEIRPASFYSSAVTQYSGFLLSCTAVLLPLISLAFPILVGSGYDEAYAIIPSFLWVAVASAVSTFVGNIFYVIKDTKTIGVSMVISCILNVVLIYPFTIWFECLGANLSVLFAFILNILLRLRILDRAIGMRVGWRSLALPSILIVVTSITYLTGLTAINAFATAVVLVTVFFMYRDKASLLIAGVTRRFGKE